MERTRFFSLQLYHAKYTRAARIFFFKKCTCNFCILSSRKHIRHTKRIKTILEQLARDDRFFFFLSSYKNSFNATRPFHSCKMQWCLLFFPCYFVVMVFFSAKVACCFIFCVLSHLAIRKLLTQFQPQPQLQQQQQKKRRRRKRMKNSHVCIFIRQFVQISVQLPLVNNINSHCIRNKINRNNHNNRRQIFHVK